MSVRRPDLIVEVQFTAGTWTDISAYVIKSASVQRGSTRVESPVIRYEPGHAQFIVNNTDRRFDPTNDAGPYSVGGVSKVNAMRPCRIRAVWNSVTYNVFRGFIDEWNVSWISNIYSECVVPITDGFKVLSNKKRSPTIALDADGKPFNVKYGESDNAGARVTRILDSATWSATDRSIAVGDTTLQATELSGDALTEIQNCVESELGEFYMDSQGRAVFRNRRAILQDTRSTTIQATFGLATNVPAPFAFQLSTDDATLWNEVIVSRTGGNEQSDNDAASQTENQTKTFQKSGLLIQDDSTARNYAQWILFISKDPEKRFDSLEINPMPNPNTLFPQILSLEIGDRIRMVRVPPGGGSPISRESFIRGIKHEIGQETWKTTYNLQSATRYIANFFILDSATNGVLNQNTLSY